VPKSRGAAPKADDKTDLRSERAYVNAALGRVLAGAPADIAFDAAGVDPKFLELVRDSPPLKAHVRRREALHECAMVELVATAARRDWRAAAWLLERQHPERWARPEARADPLTVLIEMLGTSARALGWMREKVPLLEARVAAERVTVEPANDGEDRNGGTPP
jgi:hypothetical protein